MHAWDEKVNTYRILVGKPAGRKALTRSRHSWEDNIKVELKDIGLGGGVVMSWIHLAEIGTGDTLF